MRNPSVDQKAKENAVLYTALADLGIVLLQAIFAVVTHSLTLLSEVIRGALMLLTEFSSLVILRAVHRARFETFRFGIGKLEQACNLAIGASLVVSGLWVGYRVAETLLSGYGAISSRGLALAAAVSAINLLVNALGWLAMASAARKDDSAIFRGQLRARLVKLLSSVIVQVALTIAVLTQDPLIAAWLDGLGASFVGCLMVSIGIRMVAECAPDLLDHSVPDAMKLEIENGLRAAGVGPDELHRVRTRRAGSISQVEVTITGPDILDLPELCERVEHIETIMRSFLQNSDIVVAVHAVGSESHERAFA